MQPYRSYVLGEEIKKESAIVTTVDNAFTRQYFKVLAVGPGQYEFGVLVRPDVSVGDIVIINKHAAEGDSPQELLDKGQALFLESRIMAIVEDK